MPFTQKKLKYFFYKMYKASTNKQLSSSNSNNNL